MSYAPPIDEIRFALEAVAGIGRLRDLPGGDAIEAQTVTQIFEEAGKFASEVIAPLSRGGDKIGSKLENGIVRTPPGWRDAYRAYVENGWNTLAFDSAHGGQDLPWGVSTAVFEMWQSADLSFSLCPLLTAGAIELLHAHGSVAQKGIFLRQMIAGTWTGTMNLTEPQAGSDVGALKTRAVRAGDHYKITGQKIFITYGDHDLTDNIVHMVLARTPTAPPGSRGISLFIVPKRIVNADGTLGAQNDLRVVGLEHKLGIHASPTCVMAFGDGGGATGYLIGEENRGLEYMFTMMNNARLAVGLQGVAIAERAYQRARDFARARVQSRELGSRAPEPVAIIRHPDVRRMLMLMRTGAEAARGLTYLTAVELDLARRHPDEATRTAHQLRCDLLIPVVKAWATDLAVEIASLGVQVHGGMGFIEETGAAQHYRDARILPIYEGTNGIHANDLVFRKLGRDDGDTAAHFIADIETLVAELAQLPGDDAATISAQLRHGAAALADATTQLVALQKHDPRAAAAGAAPYLRLFGLVAGGFVMAKAAAVALRALARSKENAAFLRSKLVSARFYADHWLSAAPSLVHAATAASSSMLALDDAEI